MHFIRKISENGPLLKKRFIFLTLAVSVFLFFASTAKCQLTTPPSNQKKKFKKDQVINDYTSQGYNEINKHLRGLIKAKPKIAERIDQLDKALAELPLYQGDKNGVKYLKRRTTLPPQLANKNKGEIICEPAYTSTSKAEVETTFGKNDKHLLIFSPKKGNPFKGAKDISAHSQYPNEKEVLLPRGTCAKIFHKWNLPNGNTIFFLTEPSESTALEQSKKEH